MREPGRAGGMRKTLREGDDSGRTNRLKMTITNELADAVLGVGLYRPTELDSAAWPTDATMVARQRVVMVLMLWLGR